MKKHPSHQPARASELRQDIVSGDWVLIAPERAKRTKESFLSKQKRMPTPAESCPFEDILDASGGAPALLETPAGEKWQVAVIENKYPALSHHQEICPVIFSEGPYQLLGGIGRHELLITRSHVDNFSDLKPAAALGVFKAFQERYHALRQDHCIRYVSIFQNWGSKAGASQYHPHYQLIALPVIPPDVRHSLHGSFEYYKAHKTCVHCRVMLYELKNKSRIVFENEDAVVIAPFASGISFELRVFPKHHQPHFEQAGEKELAQVVSALQQALKKLDAKLKDPDYNFFIHTAPARDERSYHHYHWHIEILPKTNIWSGFEFGTGMAINSISPEYAAAFLRGKK